MAVRPISGSPERVLTERLNHLVDEGVPERRPHDDRRRYEYVLTEKGAQLVDLLMVRSGWGGRWRAGPPVLHSHHACDQISKVELSRDHRGGPMHAGDVDLLPGPGSAV